MLWKKQSGIEIETNNDKATIEYCGSLGWEQLEEDPTGISEKDMAPDSFASNPATSGAITEEVPDNE